MNHLDLTYIKENVTDDNEFIKDLLNVFLDSMTVDMENLRDNIETPDIQLIKASAHKLKSGFRSLGMANMTAMLQDMETMALNNHPFHEIKSCFDQFEQQLPEVTEEIKEYIESAQ